MKKLVQFVSLLLILAFVLSACTPAAAPTEAPAPAATEAPAAATEARGVDLQLFQSRLCRVPDEHLL